MNGGVLVVVLVALVVSRRGVFAVEYVVGEGGCSDHWVNGCLYDSWAANYNFLVGDILVFNLDPRFTSVAMVSKSGYNTCENGLSTIPDPIYDVSPTKLELKSSGELYLIFVSGDRCYQKVHITVGFTTTRIRTTTKLSSSSESESESEPESTSGGNSTVNGIVGLLVAYGILLGSVSFTVYCVVQGRKQRQMLAQLQAQTNLQDETSPALFADGQYDVEVNEQGEYVANDQPPAAATSRSVGVGYNHRSAAADAAVFNTNLRLQDIQRSVNQLGRLG